MEENSSSVEVLGKKKNQKGTEKFKIHYLGERNEERTYLLAASTHRTPLLQAPLA